ncbi:hypothetical protein [Rhizobium changzhiense]|nr:hypothetical protein [Rhizobium changzhiense]
MSRDWQCQGIAGRTSFDLAIGKEPRKADLEDDFHVPSEFLT